VADTVPQPHQQLSEEENRRKPDQRP